MEDLIPLYKEMAATGLHFPGTAILQHVAIIRKMVDRHGAKNLLDYGCGRGDAYRAPHRMHNELNLKWYNMTLYDPAFREHQAVPKGKFDGVLCSDVLEHIPEGDVDQFVKTLFGYARKFVWASVCCRPAAKVFPGTEINVHVTIRPMDWWVETFHRIGTIDFHLTETP